MFVTRVQNIYEGENSNLFNNVPPIRDFVMGANIRPRLGLSFSSKERHYVFLLRVISRASYASLLASLKCQAWHQQGSASNTVTGVSYNIVGV
jgi:hypothetical protein